MPALTLRPLLIPRPLLMPRNAQTTRIRLSSSRLNNEHFMDGGYTAAMKATHVLWFVSNSENVSPSCIVNDLWLNTEALRNGERHPPYNHDF